MPSEFLSEISLYGIGNFARADFALTMPLGLGDLVGGSSVGRDAPRAELQPSPILDGRHGEPLRRRGERGYLTSF